MLLDCCLQNYRSPILMQSCFAIPWCIVTIIRCTIYTCFICTLACFSWTHPVLLCTPSQTSCLLFIWCSHPYRTWYWTLVSRCMFLLWSAFIMPLRNIFLDWLYIWCGSQRTQLLSHNPMLAWLIPHKINNSLLFYFMWLVLWLDLHRPLPLTFPQPPRPPLRFPYRLLIFHCCCYHSSSIKFWWQLGFYE